MDNKHQYEEKCAEEVDDWVFLRGWGRNRYHWMEFIDCFQGTFPKARIHFVDLPGFGHNNDQLSPCSVREITQHAYREFREKRIYRYNLLGVSLGGMVAMQWSLDHPEEVVRAVVMNSSAGNISPPWKRLRLASFSKVLRAALSSSREKREQHIVQLVSRLRKNDQKLLGEFQKIAKRYPYKMSNMLNQVWAARNFQLEGKLSVPTVFLASREDELVSFDCYEKLSKNQNIPLKINEKAGHDLSLDDPAWVCQEVKAWLSH